MFEDANSGEPRNVLGDWALRGFVGVVAVFVGWNKFPGDTMWVQLFQRIGIGQWFRYFTGVVEILGGMLVLVPRSAAVGLAVLAVTMAGAAVVDAWLQPGAVVIPAVLCIALGLFAWSRWKSY